MSCCPPGSHPYATLPTDYTPTGTIVTLPLSLPLYVSGSPTSTSSVIVLPEVFGWSGRLKGICDALADEGYYVVMPDCHRGDTAAGKNDIPLWVAETPWEGKVSVDMNNVMDYIKTTSPTTSKVGALGFCWGAWAGCKASAMGVGIDCIVGAHPSIKLEEFAFKSSIMDMCTACTAPTLLLSASNDPPNVHPSGEYSAVFEGKGGKTVLFPDMVHGWLSRGDVEIEEIKRDVEKGMNEIKEWLGVHLK